MEILMQNYLQIPKKSKCPVCYSGSGHVLWGVTSKQAAQHYVLQEKYPERFLELVSHIEILWGQSTCEVVQCDKCGFCYSNPYVAGDERFYNLAYERSGYPKWKWEFQITYDVLSKFSRSDLKVIEVGAGDGAFVRRIAGRILPKENILCTEFSDYGRLEIEKLGVKCLSEDIKNVSDIELAMNFDVACLFQVLEHMDNLDILFQKLSWLLRNGGSLFIAVPNARRIEFNELNGALLDMPPNHVGRWNRKSFEEIGSRNGFQVQDHKIEKESFSSMAKEFIVYRFMRKSQIRNSFANRISKLRNPYFYRMMQMVGIAANLIAAIPALTKMNPRQLGGSQWVHFIKKN